MSNSTHFQLVYFEGGAHFFHPWVCSIFYILGSIYTSKWCRNAASAVLIGKRIHGVWAWKMNETYPPPPLDSSETLYEWNFCGSLHYAVFKWPLSICSCAIRSTRSHFQRRLREVCSACLLIMQNPEHSSAFFFFFFLVMGKAQACSVEPFKHI